jgi:hypothetical protein
LQAVTEKKSRAELMTTLKIEDRVHFADTYLRSARSMSRTNRRRLVVVP